MKTLDFEQRISQLERRSKRYQAATVMLGAALIGLVCLAAEAPRSTSQEVRTKRLVVVDDTDTPVANISAAKYGGVLRLMDHRSSVMAIAGSGEHGGVFKLEDGSGHELADFSVQGQGGQISLTNEKGQKNVLTAAAVK